MDKIGQAYGAGMAGAGFDPIAFIKKPQVILRLVSWVFSVIVFGCIASQGWYTEKDGDLICLFGKSDSSCGFGTAIGVFSFLFCIAFLAIEAYFEQISSVQLRKKVVIADLGGSAGFAFFWFITFCVLAGKWSSLELDGVYASSGPQAAIAFSFFSVFTFGGSTFLAWRRYQEGSANAFAPTYEQDFSAGGVPPYGYAGAGGASESYQEPPFGAGNQQTSPQYQQATY